MQFESGDRIRHEKYGTGVVREHPDAPGEDHPSDPRNDLHFLPDDDKTTTLMRVLPSRCELIESGDA